MKSRCSSDGLPRFPHLCPSTFNTTSVGGVLRTEASTGPFFHVIITRAHNISNVFPQLSPPRRITTVFYCSRMDSGKEIRVLVDTLIGLHVVQDYANLHKFLIFCSASLTPGSIPGKIRYFDRTTLLPSEQKQEVVTSLFISSLYRQQQQLKHFKRKKKDNKTTDNKQKSTACGQSRSSSAPPCLPTGLLRLQSI